MDPGLWVTGRRNAEAWVRKWTSVVYEPDQELGSRTLRAIGPIDYDGSPAQGAFRDERKLSIAKWLFSGCRSCHAGASSGEMAPEV